MTEYKCCASNRDEITWVINFFKDMGVHMRDLLISYGAIEHTFQFKIDSTFSYKLVTYLMFLSEGSRHSSGLGLMVSTLKPIGQFDGEVTEDLWFLPRDSATKNLTPTPTVVIDCCEDI